MSSESQEFQESSEPVITEPTEPEVPAEVPSEPEVTEVPSEPEVTEVPSEPVEPTEPAEVPSEPTPPTEPAEVPSEPTPSQPTTQPPPNPSVEDPPVLERNTPPVEPEVEVINGRKADAETAAQIQQVVDSIRELLDGRKISETVIVRVVANCMRVTSKMKIKNLAKKQVVLKALEKYINEFSGLGESEIDAVMTVVDLVVSDAIDTLSELKKTNCSPWSCCK